MQSSIFEGLDIDGDGKDDEVVRSCGAGTGRLCGLYITFSTGGYNNDTETGDFYLIKINRKIYLILDIDGKRSPYTDKDSTEAYNITKDSITKICDK